MEPMSYLPAMRRRGFSLVEALVAILILVGGFGAMLSTSVQESKHFSVTRERYLANLALRNLRESFRNRLKSEYLSFPDTVDEFFAVELNQGLLTEDSILGVEPGEVGSEVQIRIQDAMTRAGIEQALAYKEFDTPDGKVGRVTFVVRYPATGGRIVELRDTFIAYD
jgi:hypothetical protein